MDFNEAFLVLGISVDSDEKTIKEAYREKLAVTNPEDDEKGFIRLRTAFEVASKYIKNRDDEAEEAEKTEADFFVDKIAAIYKNIKKRCDIEVWKEAFKDPNLQSLEMEEEYKIKLLVFLMDNYYLPTFIWKLINDVFGIVESEKKLKEQFPSDYINYVVRNILNDMEDDIDMTLFEGDEEAPYDTFIKLYYDSRSACVEHRFDDAIELIEEAKSLNVYHPIIEISYVYVLYERLNEGDAEKGVEITKKLLDKWPEKYEFIITYANGLALIKNYAEAEVYAKKALEINRSSTSMNRIMAIACSENEDYEEAKKYISEIISNNSIDSDLALLTSINDKLESSYKKKWVEEKDYDAAIDYAWCLYQNRRPTNAYSFLKNIEDSIPEAQKVDFYRLMSRACYSTYRLDEGIESADIAIQGMEKRIAESDEESLEKNKKRLVNDYLVRANIYEEKGLINEECYKKALDDYLYLHEMNAKDFSSYYYAARVYRKMREYQKAINIIDELIYDYGEYAAADGGLQCANDMRDADKLMEYASICFANVPSFYRPYDYVSDYFYAVKNWDEIDELLKKAEENDVDAWYLKANIYLKDHEYIDDDQIEEKIREFDDKYSEMLDKETAYKDENILNDVNELFYMHPSAYLYAVNADVYFQLDMNDKAYELFTKAIDEAPRYVYAYRRVAKIIFGKGDFEEAVFMRKKAYSISKDAKPIESDCVFIAKCYMCMGEYQYALDWYQEYEKISNKHNYYDNMRQCLVELGRVDEGIELIKKYSDKGEKEYHDIGNALRYGQKIEENVAFLNKQKLIIEEKNPDFLDKNSKWDDENDDIKGYLINKVFTLVDEGFDEDEMVKHIEALFSHIPEIEKYEGYWQVNGVVDFLFMLILLDKRDLWEKYRQVLIKWNEVKDEDMKHSDLQNPRLVLRTKVLTEFYYLSDDELNKMMEESHSMWVCLHCRSSFCIDVVGIELLSLLRQKRFDEAMKKIETLKEIAYDDYVHCAEMAIKLKKGLGNDSRD